MSVLLMIAAMAAQADGAVVRCAISKMPRADAAALQKGMVDGIVAGTRPSARTEALLTGLRNNAFACNPGEGRGDVRAADIAITSVAVESLSASLQKRGVNTQAIAGKLSRTPAVTLDALLEKKRTPQVEALASDMTASAGIKPADRVGSRLLGAYAFNVVRLAKLFASTAPR